MLTATQQRRRLHAGRAFAASGTTKLGWLSLTDAIRRPAELLQSMLMPAGATEGKATSDAQSWRAHRSSRSAKRSGRTRLAGGRLSGSSGLLENDEPIDYDGHHITVLKG